jgi:hypothetical protein
MSTRRGGGGTRRGAVVTHTERCISRIAAGWSVHAVGAIPVVLLVYLWCGREGHHQSGQHTPVCGAPAGAVLLGAAMQRTTEAQRHPTASRATDVADKVRTNHNKVGTNHNKVRTNHNKVGTNHNKVGTNHNKVGTNHNKVGTNHNKVGTDHVQVHQIVCAVAGVARVDAVRTIVRCRSCQVVPADEIYVSDLIRNNLSDRRKGRKRRT